ncbi:gag-polypeptide of LTR copia-type [Sesbania bispinosa]|nr:gag-polypeptide of LTR copia-type [Sesbania bispinosa]
MRIEFYTFSCSHLSVKAQFHLSVTAQIPTWYQSLLVPIMGESSRFIPQTFSNPVSEKVDESNFLICKFQVVSTIKGYKIQSFISGNGGMPKKYLSDEDEEAMEKLNPEFINWEQQDQLLTSWLVSSMTKRLTTRIIGCEYAHQVWKRLETFFTSQTRSKIKQLKDQLKNTKKTGKLTEYLLQIKEIIDMLAAVGSPLNSEEHIEAILDGLPEEYDSLINTILSRTDPYTFEERKRQK